MRNQSRDRDWGPNSERSIPSRPVRRKHSRARTSPNAAFVQARRRSAEAKVALVTSASLHHEDDDDFKYRRLRVTASSSDASPRHRGGALEPELRRQRRDGRPQRRVPDRPPRRDGGKDGAVGEVSDVHLAFAGNQFDLAAIQHGRRTRPARRCFKEHEVDVVLLTPV